MDRSTLAHPPEEIPGIEYRSAVVTFIDILGFRSFVSKTPANEVAAAIGRLHHAAAKLSIPRPGAVKPVLFHGSR